MKSLDPVAGVIDSIRIGTSHYRSIQLPRGMASVPFVTAFLQALDPDGFIWTANADRYLLTRLTLTGDTLVHIEVGLEGQPVTPEDRREAIERIEGFMERAGRADVDWDEVIPALKPVLEGLVVDDEGRVWVRRGTANSFVFDVFEPSGLFVTTVEPQFDLLQYFPPVIRNGALYGLQTDSFDVQYVVRGSVPIS